MTSLREARDRIAAHENPVSVLIYADKLMDNVRSMGPMFKLNQDDAWLLPVLENYSEHLDLWVAFVKNVRDKIERPARNQQFHDVQEWFKKLSVRLIVQKTRAILAVAVPLAIRKGMIENTVAEKNRYANRCSAEWKRRRKNLLDGARSKSTTGRVSLDVREALLKEFWDNIAAEVNNGELPKA